MHFSQNPFLTQFLIRQNMKPYRNLYFFKISRLKKYYFMFFMYTTRMLHQNMLNDKHITII